MKSNTTLDEDSYNRNFQKYRKNKEKFLKENMVIILKLLQENY